METGRKTTRYHLITNSTNKKTGPIALVTAGAQTCPTACAFYQRCYAASGPMSIHWKKVTRGERGAPFEATVKAIARLPRGSHFRWGDAGDLPGKGNTVALARLATLIQAARGKLAWCYTHKPVLSRAGGITQQQAVNNVRNFQWANKRGFTINASCEGIAHPIHVMRKTRLPVVTVLPNDLSLQRNGFEYDGVRFVRCPAEITDKIQCANCGSCRGPLCARADRDYVIYFTAHGSNAHWVGEQIRKQELEYDKA